MIKKVIFFLTVCSLPLFVNGQSILKNAQAEAELNRSKLRTHTTAAWGGAPKGYNAGAYLHKHFKRVFPDGLKIGSGINTIVFTNAQAVTDFMPANGRARVLTESYTDPNKRDMRNSFLSQIIALKLNASFDEKIESYSPSNVDLNDMFITRGALVGLTVSEVLEEASSLVSGEGSRFGIVDLNETITLINENYLNGEVTGNFLVENAEDASLKDARRAITRR